MKSISQIADELNIKRHTVYQMIIRNDIQPDEVGKNRLNLYGDEKELIIKNFFKENSQNISSYNKISCDNHINANVDTLQDILSDNKMSCDNYENMSTDTPKNILIYLENLKKENSIYLKTSQELQDKLKEVNNQIEFLQNQCNNLMEQNSKLLDTIQELQQANRELQQTSTETIKDIQRNNADTIQALKNSQILHAETMKAEILALNDNSNKKHHWWQFWKR